MSKVSDSIRPLGAKVGPLSGMGPQDEFFEYRGLGSPVFQAFYRLLASQVGQHIGTNQWR
jgi:hypothetical protein